MQFQDQPLTHYTPSLELSSRRMKSSDLLKTGRELFIEHGDQLYRLIRTSNDKLLLVK